MKKDTNIHLKYVFLITTCKCSYDSLAKMLERLFFFKCNFTGEQTEPQEVYVNLPSVF